MAGYNYFAGMSNNAVSAYNRGVKPLSKIKLSDLRAAGWTETKQLAIAIAKSDDGLWRSSEWHHSGGTWYNQVDFYDPIDLVENWNDLTDAEKTQSRERHSPPKNPSEKQEFDRVKGKYAVWGGTRRHPKLEGWKEFEGELRGNWIHLDGGGKKLAHGKNIWYFAIKDCAIAD